MDNDSPIFKVLDSYGFALRYMLLCDALSELPDDLLVIYGDQPTRSDLNATANHCFECDDSLTGFVGFNGQDLYTFMQKGSLYLIYGPRDASVSDEEYAEGRAAIASIVKETLSRYEGITVDHDGDPKQSISVSVNIDLVNDSDSETH